MASIEPYETKAGKRWRVRYRTVDHKASQKRGFLTKRDAQAWLDDNATNIRTGHYVKPSRGRTTVGEIAGDWHASREHRVKPSTWRREADYLERIEADWGTTPVAKVTGKRVQEWLDGLTHDDGRPLSPSSKRQLHWALSSILDRAVADRLIVSNPARKRRRGSGADGVELPKVQARPRVYLTADQLDRLATAAGPMHDLVLFLGLTGLRVGEAGALRVEDVDLNARRITVARTSTLVGGRLVEGPPKNGRPRRVSYPRLLEPILENAMRGKPRAELLFDMPDGGRVRADNLRHRYVLPAQEIAGRAVATLQEALRAPRTGRMDADTMKAVIDAQEATGLPATGTVDAATWRALNVDDEPLTAMTLRPGAEDFGTITTHDLRHTAASLAISSGASAKAVQRMLGHRSAAMTLDVYADLFEDDLDDVADAMDRLIGSTHR